MILRTRHEAVHTGNYWVQRRRHSIASLKTRHTDFPMSKKRKNAQKKAANLKTAAASETTLAASDQSSSVRKKRFESFPLHLVPNENYAGKYETAELQELCKGRVWVIPSFFSSKECKAWIDYCESFSPSNGFQYTAHPANKYITNRECYRLQQENATELSERIFERLRGMKGGSLLGQIQKETSDIYPSRRSKEPSEYKPINCNPNIRVYRYDEGHAFGRHVDESNVLDDGTTEMTMLVYLSTCQGGATRFYRSISGNRRSRQPDSSFAFQPQVGTLLLHVHGQYCLEHEAEVVSGGQKYVLRTDLVYGNAS